MPRVRFARPRPSAAALMLGLMMAAPATAQTTVQSTLGPGDSFEPAAYFQIGAIAPAVNPNHEVATSFVYSGASGFDLFDLGLALRQTSSPALPVTYRIRFRRGTDFITSSLVQGWSYSTTIVGPTTLERFDFAPGISLVTGETYWIHVLGPSGESSIGGWAYSSPAVFGPSGSLLLNSDDLGNWTESMSPLPAYALRATATAASVPEPLTASLLLLAVAPLAWRARRRVVA